MKAVHPDMPTLLLINPASRRGTAAFEHYRATLQTQLALHSAMLTQSEEDMRDRIRTGLAQGIKRFIIGGGDGTLSAAADILAQTEGILGIIPLGTGNTFAHGLSLPSRSSDLCSLLSTGPVAQLDVGIAQHGQESKVFLNSLTIGFSERLVELLERRTKDRLGHLAWVVQFRRALQKTPVFEVALKWPNGSDRYLTRQLVVVNGRTIAAGIAATPSSSAQDGLLEVFRLGDPSLRSIFRIGIKLLLGKLFSERDAHYVTLSEVDIETHPPLPLNIDGEVWSTPPVTCKVLPSSLSVISPSGNAQSPHRWPIATHTLGPRPLVPKKSYSISSRPPNSG